MSSIFDKAIDLVCSTAGRDSHLWEAILVSLFTGIIMAPFGDGWLALIIYIIIVELIIYLISLYRPGCWSLEVRLGIVAASILGWLIGRTLRCLPPLNRGALPLMKAIEWLQQYCNTNK